MRFLLLQRCLSAAVVTVLQQKRFNRIYRLLWKPWITKPCLRPNVFWIQSKHLSRRLQNHVCLSLNSFIFLSTLKIDRWSEIDFVWNHTSLKNNVWNSLQSMFQKITKNFTTCNYVTVNIIRTSLLTKKYNEIISFRIRHFTTTEIIWGKKRHFKDH